MSGTPLYLKQIFWLLIGLTVMVTIAFIEYRFYSDFAYIVYSVALFLLMVVLGYGIITSGAQRWVKIGSLSFQPSEFVKISLILALAKVFPSTSRSKRLFFEASPFAFSPPFSADGLDP